MSLFFKNSSELDYVSAEGPSVEDRPLISLPDPQLVHALAERSELVHAALARLLMLETPAAFLHEDRLVLADGGLEVPDWTRGRTQLTALEDCHRNGFQLFTEPLYRAFRELHPAADATSKVWFAERGTPGFARFGATKNEKLYVGEAGINRPYSLRGYRRTWSVPIMRDEQDSIQEILVSYLTASV